MTNQRITSKIAALALCLTLPFVFTACDVFSLENPADDFDLIIGLEPINTVVNAQIVDAGTLEPITQPVHLTFSGEAAGSLIDVYSDPVSEFTVQSGFVTFGIENELTPTEDNPVTFTATGEAEGYFTNSVEVVLADTGSGAFLLRLTPDNPQQNVAGASGTTDQSASTTESGAVTSNVTVQTPEQEDTEAQATVSVPEGSVPVTKNGTPLTGQLTTELRVFDSGEGLTALPNAAKLMGDGGTLALAGAAFFRMSDENDNVAVSFESASSGKSASCASGITSLSIEVTEASIITAYNALASADQGVEADIWVYTPADQNNAKVGTIVLESSGGVLTATICLGASSLDLGELGDVSEGIIFSVALAGGQVTSCPLNSTVSISNPNGSDVSITAISLVGAGLNLSAPGRIVPANRSISGALSALVNETDNVTVVSGASYQVVATVGGEQASVAVSDPCSGSYSLTLPQLSSQQAFTINASLACPAGQTFDVQLTDESVDALSLFYRESGVRVAFQAIDTEAITKEITESSISASLTLSLKPSTSYTFKAVYGEESATQEISTPGSSTTVTVELSPEETGLTCS